MTNQENNSRPAHIEGVTEIKFLLILGVVMQHCNYIFRYPGFVEDYPGSVSFLRFIVSNFCDASVPCFFIISGFLFFNGVESLTPSLYFRKLKSRVYTLFIPYMFWNLVCCGLLWLRVRYLGANGDEIFFADDSVNLSNFFKGFFSKSPNTYPYAFAFWFIRNLMVFVILSPIICLIAKNIALVVLMVAAYYYFNLGSCFILTDIEWFVIGAFLVYHKQLIPRFKKRDIYIAFALLVILVALREVVGWNMPQFIVIMYLVYCLGLCLHRRLEQNSLFKLIISSTFMIYATHQCYSRWLCENLTDRLGGGFGCAPIVVYILCVGIMAGVGIGLDYFLRRFLPRFCRFITGGR